MKILNIIITLLTLQTTSRLIVDESLYYFTNLKKLEHLLKNRNLMECIFLEKSKLAVNIDCFKNKNIEDIEKHYTNIIGKIIKNILKDDKKEFCYNLKKKLSLELCQNIIREDFNKYIKLDISSIKKKNAYERIITIFMQYFKILINHGKENLKNLNTKPFFENINKFIEKEIVDVVGKNPVLAENEAFDNKNIVVPLHDQHFKGKNVLGFAENNLKKVKKEDVSKIKILKNNVQVMGFYNSKIPISNDIYYKQNLEEKNLKGKLDQNLTSAKNGLNSVRGEIVLKRNNLENLQNVKIIDDFERKNVGDLKLLEEKLFSVLGNIKNSDFLRNEIVVLEQKLEVIIKKTQKVTVLKNGLDDMKMGKKKKRRLNLLGKLQKEIDMGQRDIEEEIMNKKKKFLKKGRNLELERKLANEQDSGKKNEILEKDLENLKENSETFEKENKKMKSELEEKIDELQKMENKENTTISDINKLEGEIMELKEKEEGLIKVEMLDEKTQNDLKKTKIIQEDINKLNDEKIKLDEDLKNKKVEENLEKTNEELKNKIDELQALHSNPKAVPQIEIQKVENEIANMKKEIKKQEEDLKVKVDEPENKNKTTIENPDQNPEEENMKNPNKETTEALKKKIEELQQLHSNPKAIPQIEIQKVENEIAELQKKDKEEIENHIQNIKLNERSEGIEKQVLINDIISKLETSKKNLDDIGLNAKFQEETNKSQVEIDKELERAYEVKENLDKRVEKNEIVYKEEFQKKLQGEDYEKNIEKEKLEKFEAEKKEKEELIAEKENIGLDDKLEKIEDKIKKDEISKQKLLDEF